MLIAHPVGGIALEREQLAWHVTLNPIGSKANQFRGRSIYAPSTIKLSHGQCLSENVLRHDGDSDRVEQWRKRPSQSHHDSIVIWCFNFERLAIHSQRGNHAVWNAGVVNELHREKHVTRGKTYSI